MSHYGTLGSYRFATAAEDIRGSKLYGVDDKKLGKIDDVIFDHSTGDIRYVVVDTGGWLTHHKFIVPSDRLRTSAEHQGDFSSDLTKERIESLPPYQESDLKSEEKWSDYENRYRAKWEMNPVMHRAETDRNISPTTQQLEGNRSSMEASGSGRRNEPTGSPSQADVNAANSPSERIVPAGTDSVVISNSAVGIGGRWDTFQARLRERRKETVAACQSCTVGPASERGSESVTDEKKAV
ncbi:MAG TPA: PRC-barrel domain-containing protein [Terriglobales bacterium]|nr:PRC-barrel domain-containing protein [Terriglobales bacterium]